MPTASQQLDAATKKAEALLALQQSRPLKLQQLDEALEKAERLLEEQGKLAQEEGPGPEALETELQELAVLNSEIELELNSQLEEALQQAQTLLSELDLTALDEAIKEMDNLLMLQEAQPDNRPISPQTLDLDAALMQEEARLLLKEGQSQPSPESPDRALQLSQLQNLLEKGHKVTAENLSSLRELVNSKYTLREASDPYELSKALKGRSFPYQWSEAEREAQFASARFLREPYRDPFCDQTSLMKMVDLYQASYLTDYILPSMDASLLTETAGYLALMCQVSTEAEAGEKDIGMLSKELFSQIKEHSDYLPLKMEIQGYDTEVQALSAILDRATLLPFLEMLKGSADHQALSAEFEREIDVFKEPGQSIIKHVFDEIVELGGKKPKATSESDFLTQEDLMTILNKHQFKAMKSYREKCFKPLIRKYCKDNPSDERKPKSTSLKHRAYLVLGGAASGKGGVSKKISDGRDGKDMVTWTTDIFRMVKLPGDDAEEGKDLYSSSQDSAYMGRESLESWMQDCIDKKIPVPDLMIDVMTFDPIHLSMMETLGSDIKGGMAALDASTALQRSVSRANSPDATDIDRERYTKTDLLLKGHQLSSERLLDTVPLGCKFSIFLTEKRELEEIATIEKQTSQATIAVSNISKFIQFVHKRSIDPNAEHNALLYAPEKGGRRYYENLPIHRAASTFSMIRTFADKSEEYTKVELQLKGLTFTYSPTGGIQATPSPDETAELVTSLQALLKGKRSPSSINQEDMQEIQAMLSIVLYTKNILKQGGTPTQEDVIAAITTDQRRLGNNGVRLKLIRALQLNEFSPAPARTFTPAAMASTLPPEGMKIPPTSNPSKGLTK